MAPIQWRFFYHSTKQSAQHRKSRSVGPGKDTDEVWGMEQGEAGLGQTGGQMPTREAPVTGEAGEFPKRHR